MRRLVRVLSASAIVLGVAGCLQKTDGVDLREAPPAEEPSTPGATPPGGVFSGFRGPGAGGSNVQLLSESACVGKPFLPPTLVAGFDSRDILSARLSTDETRASLALADGANVELYEAARTTPTDPFVIGDPISSLNTGADEYWPTMSSDRKSIVFESGRNLVAPPDGGAYTNEQARIWIATRTSTSVPFEAPKVPWVFQVPHVEGAPYIPPSGRSLYFVSYGRSGGAGDGDIFVAALTDLGVVISIGPVGEVNGTTEENHPLVTDDEHHLFFSRYGAGTGRDVWVAGRASTDVPFGINQQVVEINSDYDDFPSSVSSDGCRLYFISNRPVGGVSRYRVWLAARPE